MQDSPGAIGDTTPDGDAMSPRAPLPGEAFGVPLPGGTSVSHVRVYDTIGPDGLAGGSPHLHTVCTEAYLVIAGEGIVQTLSGEGFAETPLVAGTIAWFSPGTIHRLVNLDGRLELYVLMSNAGLPEAGDMILAFAPDLLADDATYRRSADLPADARTTDDRPDAAIARRDAAVAGFLHWRAAVDERGPRALDPLYRAAVDLLGDRPHGWAELLAADPAADLERSRSQVDALTAVDRSGAATRLAESAIRTTSLHPDTRRMGCCGTLGTVVH
jgi:mannose-6-phosphate isomerase-like protein (cupin superfamily)